MAKYNEKTKIWTGPKTTPTFNLNQNMGQCLLYALSLSLDDVVQISADTGVELTGGEIRTRAIRTAQNLRQQGFKERDILAIAAPSSEHVAPVMFGCFLIGAPVNLLDPEFNTADYVNMLGQTKPKLIFCESNNFPIIKKALIELQMEDTKLVTLDKGVEGAGYVEDFYVKRGSDLVFMSPIIEDPDNYILAITCSSGTTGFSKGVMISHQALLQNAIMKYDDDESVILTGSLYWISILRAVITTTLSKNRRIISRETFQPETHMSYIQKYRPKYMILSPTRLALMLQSPHIQDYDLSSIRMIAAGGSVLHQSLIQKFHEIIPRAGFLSTYGASEVTNSICMGLANPKKPGSPGQAISGNEVKIVSDTGKALDNGEQGEIWVRRKVMFSGYFGAPEKRAEVIDEDGWYHTGDIGYFDEDGFIYIVDRIKDIILYKNFWVAPAPLEEKIQSLRGVKHAVVVGIPDEVCVELPAALIVPDEECVVTEKDVRHIIEENFSEHKQLKGGVYFVDSVPMTPSGKIKRRDLKTVAIRLYNELIMH